MKLPGYIAIILVILMAWGSLFLTVIDQASKLRGVSNQEIQLSSQLKQVQLKASAARSAQLQTILQDMQCIANFFAQPNRSSTVLNPANLQQCTLQKNTVGTSGGSAGATKSN